VFCKVIVGLAIVSQISALVPSSAVAQFPLQQRGPYKCELDVVDATIHIQRVSPTIANVEQAQFVLESKVCPEPRVDAIS
jgi:hypothetical protein